MPGSVTSRPRAPKAPGSRRAPGKAMISSDRISKRVRQLGREISEVYTDIETPLVIVAILKGATVFAADLLRSLNIPAELEFVRAASYGAGTRTTGRVKIAHMVEGSLEGRHVLLVEDIVDSGRTIDTIQRRFRKMKPAALEAERARRVPGDHVRERPQLAVPRHLAVVSQDERGLHGGRGTERIPRVHHRVMADAHVDARRKELLDARVAAPYRIAV